MNQTIQPVEVVLYGVLNFVPYVPCVLLPFREKYRFSRGITYLLVAVAGVVEVINHYAVYRGFSPSLSTLITTLISLSLGLLLLKVHPGKIVMTMLIVQNVALLILQFAKYTESIVFHEHSFVAGSWTLSLCLVIWQIPFLSFYLWFMKQYFAPAVTRNHNRMIWRYLWIIPLTFYLIWETYIASNPDFASYTLQQRTSCMAMIVSVSVGSFFIYYITTLLLSEQTKSENYAMQYKSLNGRIQDARRARHDVRHHLVIIQNYLEDGKYEELKEYVSQYRTSMPMEEALSYCDHYASNALLTYFVQRAKEAKIDYSIAVSFPSQLPVSDDDLTVVFGNLLENALDACREGLEQDPSFEARITVKGSYEGGSLVISVRNTTIREAVMDKNNQFLSTKHEGNGIGIESVRDIARKHHGVVKITQEDHTFSVMVMMI